MPPSWANTEPDSTSAWTRSPASCPPQRGWTRRWGRGSSTIYPLAWARWCPWTIRSRPRPNRRTWLSPSTCSSHPHCRSTVLLNSVLPTLCPPKCLVGSSWCPQQTDSSPFWSPTRPLPPPQPPSSLFTQTQECLLRSTPVLCMAVRHLPQHLQSTAWRPSLGDPKRSARSGSAVARRATSPCGGPGNGRGESHEKHFCMTVLHETFNWLHTISVVKTYLWDGNSSYLIHPSGSRCFVLWNIGCLNGTRCLYLISWSQYLEVGDKCCTCRWKIYRTCLYEVLFMKRFSFVQSCYWLLNQSCVLYFLAVLCWNGKKTAVGWLPIVSIKEISKIEFPVWSLLLSHCCFFFVVY